MLDKTTRSDMSLSWSTPHFLGVVLKRETRNNAEKVAHVEEASSLRCNIQFLERSGKKEFSGA